MSHSKSSGSQGRGQNSSEISTSGDGNSGRRWPVTEMVVLGGVAAVGAIAYWFFTSNSSRPTMTYVEERFRENVNEIFRTRNISGESCNICMEALKGEEEPSQPLAMLRCGHVFHQTCITEWLNTQAERLLCPDCPACRAPDPTNTTGRNLHPYCQF